MKKSILTIFGLNTLALAMILAAVPQKAFGDDEVLLSPEELAALQQSREEEVVEETSDSDENTPEEKKEDGVVSKGMKNQSLGVIYMGVGSSNPVVFENGMESSGNVGLGIFRHGGHLGAGLAVNPSSQERIGRRETDDALVTTDGELVEIEGDRCTVVDADGRTVRECSEKAKANLNVQAVALPVWRSDKCEFDGQNSCWALTLSGWAETGFSDDTYGVGSVQLRKMKMLGEKLMVHIGAGGTIARGGKTDLTGLGFGGGFAVQSGKATVVTDVTYGIDAFGGYKKNVITGSVAGHYDTKHGDIFVNLSGEDYEAYAPKDPERKGVRGIIGIAGSHDYASGDSGAKKAD